MKGKKGIKTRLIFFFQKHTLGTKPFIELQEQIAITFTFRIAKAQS